ASNLTRSCSGSPRMPGRSGTHAISWASECWAALTINPHRTFLPITHVFWPGLLTMQDRLQHTRPTCDQLACPSVGRCEMTLRPATLPTPTLLSFHHRRVSSFGNGACQSWS